MPNDNHTQLTDKLNDAHDHLHDAAELLNEACALPAAPFLLYRDIRLLRTMRNNTENAYHHTIHLLATIAQALLPPPDEQPI